MEKPGKENTRLLRKDHKRAPFDTSIEGTPDTHLKVKPESNIRETPRRMQRTREASREDAIASTQQFFAAVNERIRSNIIEGPVVITSEVCDRNENDVLITSTSVVDTAPVVPETETTETETQSPRTFLPNGSPSRPIATATCRPEHGCNMFWKDKSMNLPKMIPIQQKVVEQKPLY